MQLLDLRERIHKVGQGQGCPVGTVKDRLLDVRSEQAQSQDAGRIAGAGDLLVAGDLLDAIVLALGEPAVPALLSNLPIWEACTRRWSWFGS